MKKKKDYYEILGVDKNSSQEEIKKAFRQLARKYHPDVAGKEYEEKFKEINEAFQILSDPEKRAQYDQFGHAAFQHQHFNDFKWQSFDDIFNDFGFSDIFNFDIFSDFEEETSNIRNIELKYDINISLEEAFNGVKKKIEIPKFITCDACRGTGAKQGYLKKCVLCKGTGKIRTINKTAFAHIINIIPCSKCGGRGEIIEKKCERCNGRGKIKISKRIELTIPKGIEDDSVLRIHDENNDLYIVVHIKPHPIFERYENHLYCKTIISLVEAIFGSEIEIPTINGKVKIRIPKGTQSHTIFRLRGLGMPDIHSHKRGDLFVKVIVKIPDKLTKTQYKILKEVMEEYREKPKTMKGFFEKSKEYFK